ncbi:SH3 domain-containing protein [Nonomuraea sp. NPDC049625]|uniref:SH3 domain-containing protein n=1 Tax=Nonomuraea sp. NPDC049625 TaxID=3155775 RepID=UPI00343DF66B
MRSVHTATATATAMMAVTAGCLALTGLPAQAAPRRNARVLGHLRSGDRAIAGSCAGKRGWLRVTTPAGVRGWAWNGYLRKSTTVSLRSTK